MGGVSTLVAQCKRASDSPGLWFALQLLRRLQSENARLEAALEWRCRELVFWQWMVRKLGWPPSLALTIAALGWDGASSLFPEDRKRRLGATHHPGLQPALHSGLQL